MDVYRSEEGRLKTCLKNVSNRESRPAVQLYLRTGMEVGIRCTDAARAAAKIKNYCCSLFVSRLYRKE